VIKNVKTWGASYLVLMVAVSYCCWVWVMVVGALNFSVNGDIHHGADG
jgi:hypothetical protein